MDTVMYLRCAAILLCSILHAQTVRIVDAGAGGPGALQAAVDASSPGDILRIKPGTYTKTAVRRGLKLLADPTADCHQLIASGIPAGETLAVVGLNLVGIPGADNKAADAPLRVESCSGRVFFSSAMVTARATLQTNLFALFIPVTAVARVERAELHAENATFKGIDWQASYSGNSHAYYPGGPAISAVDARVTLSSCFVQGGSGATWTKTISVVCQYGTGTSGSPGLVARNSLLSVDRCQVGGGNGGSGGPGGCYWPPCGSNAQTAGSSASAADLSGGSQFVGLGNSTIAAGTGGLSACGRPTPSEAIGGSGCTLFLHSAVTVIPEQGAQPINASHQVITRLLPSLEGKTPRATLNASVSWTHRDQPGAYAFFLLGAVSTVSIPHPIILGGVDIQLSNGLTFGPWLVPSAGQVPFSFTIPNDPALNGAGVYLQTVGVDAALLPAATPLTAVFVNF